MTIKLKLFADYHQFYIQDENASGDLSESWTEQAVMNLLALAPGTVGIGTVRDVIVPVQIDILEKEPTEDFDQWDHVTECSIDVPSGKLVVAGCTDYFPTAKRIDLTPGTYRARIYYGQLDSLSYNGLEGNDNYKVSLWKNASADPIILKRWHKATTP